MGRTQLSTREIGSVQRNDFDITTSGQAVITKIVAGTNVSLSSTGVDAGTGDVTINVTSTGGMTRIVATSSGNFTAGAATNTDYIYLIAGAHTMTLPTAVGNTNMYTVKNKYTSAITINTTSSQNIDNALTILINPLSSVDLISDNSNWWVV